MPLYEYECEACSHRFEMIQKWSDPPADTCPKCGSKVQKLPSSPAIQFKGSGFYITDYARSGKNNEGGPSGKSESSSASGDNKSDSKSETKSESKSESESKAESKAESKSKSETKGETKSESKPSSTASS